MIFVIAVSLWIVRLIMRPIAEVERTLKAMADGDLTARADVDTRDEFGRMAAALTAAQELVLSVVRTVAEND